MKEQSIARVYARSIMALGKERNVDVATELTRLTEVINANNSLESCLFLDVFTMGEKESVLGEILKRLQSSDLVRDFLFLLVRERRIGLFPLVFKEIIVIDDNEKGFIRGVIEGADECLSDLHEKKLAEHIAHIVGKKPVLSYKQSSQVSAGYKVTVEDLQLDASLDSQLERFKNSILGEETR